MNLQITELIICMLRVFSAGGKTDDSGSLNRWYELPTSIEARRLYSGEAVTLMSVVYSLSTHRLQGGLFIDLSLFSASTSVPSFSPSPFFLPPSPLMGWYFWSYYLLCIFEVQITSSQIVNSKIRRVHFISSIRAAPRVFVSLWKCRDWFKC